MKRKNKKLPLTHSYAHLLVNMHLAAFAPAFTLSFHDSERSRKWNIPCNGYRQMPIASVVMGKYRKIKRPTTI